MKIDKQPLFVSYLSRPGFKLLSCLLQCFGHIKFKNKDTKSVVRKYFLLKIEKCDHFLVSRMPVDASGNRKKIVITFVIADKTELLQCLWAICTGSL